VSAKWGARVRQAKIAGAGEVARVLHTLQKNFRSVLGVTESSECLEREEEGPT
jgi:hypothetical protein